MTVELVLVRHGQTTANAARRLSGRGDVGLSETGERQIELVADHLAGAHVDDIVTSPLTRAQLTAQALASRLGRQPRIDDRLIELDYGRWEGVGVGDLGADVWRDWRQDLSFRPPQGETLAEVGERVRRALADWVNEWSDADGRIVVVSHVSPIKAITCAALGLGDEFGWKLYLAPASITRLRVDRSGGQLLSFNEVVADGGAGSTSAD